MIFYFSATGNTRWAAHRLAAATHEQLVDMAALMRSSSTGAQNEPFTLKEGERLGFVFPVHGWRVPKLVRRCISQLKLEAGHQPFTYCVCTAGDSVGQTVDGLNKVIQSTPALSALNVKGVSSAWSLIMPESYVGLPFMDVDPKEKEARKKAMASETLNSAIEDILMCRNGVTKLTKGFWPWFMSKVIGGFFEGVLITDKRFHVTHERCVKCGICANVCPVGDINGGQGHKPVWLHHEDCLTCFNCYHHCPHHAIEFGHQTQKKGQYFFK